MWTQLQKEQVETEPESAELTPPKPIPSSSPTVKTVPKVRQVRHPGHPPSPTAGNMLGRFILISEFRGATDRHPGLQSTHTGVTDWS
jgi:hypothetical protein